MKTADETLAGLRDELAGLNRKIAEIRLVRDRLAVELSCKQKEANRLLVHIRALEKEEPWTRST